MEKYIDHVHTINGKPSKVPEKLEAIILDDFNSLMKLHNRGIKVFFTDIDKIKKQMLKKLEK